jgi:periplasmic copper chaperone A
MRLPLVVAGVAAAWLVLAAPAYAHVTVSSPDATQGGEAVLTFQVPTESDTASTTGLRVQLPTDTPFASVLVRPHPGWTFTTKTVRLAHPITTDDGDQVAQTMSEVDWRANSAATAIKPGEFDEFVISAGPLPEADTVTFKAIQVYSDGSQVNWTDVPAPGSTAEPEHPAPTLKLAVANPGPSRRGGSSQTGSVVLASIALAVAIVALGVAVVRRRRT